MTSCSTDDKRSAGTISVELLPVLALLLSTENWSERLPITSRRFQNSHEFAVATEIYKRSEVIQQVIILAAGMGTRLGKPWPKPLTPLRDGRTIMEQQMSNITQAFGDRARIGVVVGFKMEMIMEAHPRAVFIYCVFDLFFSDF